MADHLGSYFDELLPQRRQRPMLHRPRKGQPTQEVAQVVCQGEQLQPNLVVHEVVTGQFRPLSRWRRLRHLFVNCVRINEFLCAYRGREEDGANLLR